MAGILSKGIKLSYGASATGTWTEIANIQEIPALGGTSENIDVTCLQDSNFKYINGIKDFGELQFKCLFDNSGTDSNYRTLHSFETSKTAKWYCVEFPDAVTEGTGTHHGTQFIFQAYVTVATEGVGVNAPITFTADFKLQSDVSVTDPA